MVSTTSKETERTWFSPWLIIGSVCILAIILLVLAVKNVRWERQFMVRALLSQAETLMHSLEASSRSGMMGMGGDGMGMGHMGMHMGPGRGQGGWGRQQLQLLMEQTAQQPEVLYVRLLQANGRIIADSDRAALDTQVPFTPPPPGQTIYRFVERGEKAFEVFRSYQPWSAGRDDMHGSQTTASESLPKDQYLIVGLNPGPLEEASRQDRNQTIFLFGVMFLVGATGFISLFWANHYRSARRSLQDIEAYTGTIFGQMPVGLIATETDGTIHQTNASARRILNDHEGLTGKIERLSRFSAVFQATRETRAAVEREILCELGAGRSVPLWLNASPILDADGRISGYVFLFTDMSAIKQLEEQVRRSERMAALGRMAAGIAHEIRNPLSSIKGFATILAGQVEGDESAGKIARVMQQEVERLNRAVTELLEFARPMEISKQKQSLRELIRHVQRLVQDDARQRDIEILVEVEPAELEITVDPDRFAQILLNLELNALQAMQHSGRLHIRGSGNADRVTVTVTDTGPGIAPEHLPHIFDPYFTTKAHGVGLGLAVVNKLVEAHGGDIEATSRAGQGTRFTLQFPAE